MKEINKVPLVDYVPSEHATDGWPNTGVSAFLKFIFSIRRFLCFFISNQVLLTLTYNVSPSLSYDILRLISTALDTPRSTVIFVILYFSVHLSWTFYVYVT